ncbi:MAG: hypothetical protein H6724_06025 [Sandaracinus sp.]|nr:hypothetical protein [Sandaracinus sp.]
MPGRWGERVGLAQDALFALTLAAHVHDLGKTGSYHHAAERGAPRGAPTPGAEGLPDAGAAFEAASLPKDTFSALRHLYERWDGKGFPDEMHGKEILMGRVSSPSSRPSDLTSHAKNSLLPPAHACRGVLGRRRALKELFDPTLAAVLKQVEWRRARQRLLADRRTVLLVDPDPKRPRCSTCASARRASRSSSPERPRGDGDARRRAPSTSS